jgi:hypothetical protein
MMKGSCLASALSVIVLAAPAWSVEKPHWLKPTKLEIGVYLASEFDAATTYHLLQNCSSQCYEANPLVRPLARNPGVFVALGASAYGVNYFARRLENSGHHRWATALRVLAIGVHAGAGVQALALEH